MPTTKTETKYLPLLAMIYMVVALCDLISVYRLTTIGSLTIAAGIYILPFYYFLEDVIAEVYGYKHYRQVLWMMLAGCFVFSGIMTMVIHLPTPSFWQHKNEYLFVFSHLFRTTLGGGCVAILCGAFINGYFVTRWKILLNGKYFWLRSIGASAIGQGVQNLIGCLVLYVGVIPLHEVFKMILPLYFIQLGIEAVIATPGTFLVSILKKAEGGIDAYDVGTNFNPFKFQIKNENPQDNSSQTTATSIDS